MPDYPRHLLDIKLVLEEDDLETVAAARALEGAAGTAPFEIVEVPPGGPRTKPKAANYALAFARGDYLVVYDAEDRPESDQLRKAVATFRAAPRRTACLQARLNFYNADHNWLTRVLSQVVPTRTPCIAT
jgi:cellulose synthase/poly-beta-1,6-N-acetylglucosamine synthase-like glycosyltransferase